jgi:ribonuclease-3
MLPDSHDVQVRRFLEALGVEIEKIDVFRAALTHGSCLNECSTGTHGSGQLEANERLEFLGDAVLGLIMAHHLYARLPGHHEGQLSKAKAHLVSAEILARHARRLGLGELLLLGRGEELTGGRTRDSILANTMEAVIGAWFLTEGLAKVQQFVLDLWAEDFEQEILKPGDTDYKSLLQELSQKVKQELPVYTVENIHGPDHNRMYEISVSLAGQEYGRGTGRNKKEAAQTAAAQALTSLKKDISKFGEEE